MQIRNTLITLLLVLLSTIVVSCASPAHENTGYLGHEIHSIFVTVHSLDNYEIDGYLVDNKGLAAQVKSLTSSHSLKSMTIEANRNASLLDQAFAVYIGEKNNLETYRRTLFWSEEISSKQLLAELDESNEDGFLD